MSVAPSHRALSRRGRTLLGRFFLSLRFDNEIAHHTRAFLVVRLQQQMRAVVEVHVDPIEIPGIRIGLFDFVVWVVAPPKKQRWRLMIAMIGFTCRKAGRMGAVVGENAELDVDSSRLAHALPVEVPTVRRDKRHQTFRNIANIGVLYPFKIQPFGNLCEVFARRIGPIRLDEIPRLSEALVMGVAVLDDQPEHTFRIFHRQRVSDSRPEIMNVKKEPMHADLAQQRVDGFGHGLEGVGVVLGRFRKSEARQVRGDNMRDFGQRADDVTEIE